MIRYSSDYGSKKPTPEPHERYDSSDSDWINDVVGAELHDARYVDGILFLNLKDGACLRLVPEGDCCSRCYIQHVSGADALVGSTVSAVDVIESTPTGDELSDINVLDAWGYRITTGKGVCSIEMRLSHNGYYGGTLDGSKLMKWSEASALRDF